MDRQYLHFSKVFKTVSLEQSIVLSSLWVIIEEELDLQGSWVYRDRVKMI
jgi:hypothetical protein